jgi:hypothetical protein
MSPDRDKNDKDAKKQDDGESGGTASEPADADLTLEPTDGGGEEPDQQADPRWR